MLDDEIPYTVTIPGYAVVAPTVAEESGEFPDAFEAFTL
jgi:hypothetical protein